MPIIGRVAEGVAALLDRQKMIRLADSSENSWAMVAEYRGNIFPDNEEIISQQ